MTLDWQTFTMAAAISAVLGGCLIGLAAVWLAWSQGRIAGISGILGQMIESRVRRQREPIGWRVAFLGGLLAAPLLWLAFADLPEMVQQTGTMGLVVGGLLVGLGTRYANGCTSGHGICGLSRFSLRSLVAVACFMGSAMLTVYVLRHLLEHAQ